MSAHSNIMVIHGGALGDFVLTCHLVQGIKAAHPHAAVHMVARSGLLPWAVENGGPDQGVFLHDPFIQSLFSESFDRHSSRAPRWNSMSGIISLIGRPGDTFHRNVAAYWGVEPEVIDPRPDSQSPALHMLGQWRKALIERGFPVADRLWTPAWEPITRDLYRTALRTYLNCPADQVVILHPGSGGKRKCAPLPFWFERLREWQSRGFQTAWMVGPDELEREGPDFVHALRPWSPVIQEPSLPDAARLLLGADAFVGHDAGMTHLAAACGLPTTAYFVATHPALWAPLGPRVNIVYLSHHADRSS